MSADDFSLDYQSEEQFRIMADAVPQIVWITDADGGVEFFNKQWFDYIGSPDVPPSASEVAARYVHPDDEAETIAGFDEARRTGSTYMVEHRIRSAAGDYRWFLVRGEPYRDPASGEIVRWFGTSVNIHDRKLAEEALRDSEARLGFLDALGAQTASLADADAVLATTTRLLGEHLDLSVCAYADMDEDEDGFTIRGDWAAPGSTSIVGHYSLADFGKLAVKNLGAGLPLVVNDNRRELAPEEAATFQNIGITATICMPLVKEGRLTALMAVHDRVPRVWTEAELSLVREVTARSWAHIERIAALAELRDSEERLRESLHRSERKAAELGAVLESMPDAVYIGTAEGITLANQPALDQLGFATREDLNRHVATLAEEIQTRDAETGEFIPPEDQAFTRAFGGQRVVQDVRVRHRFTGEDRVVRCAAAPVMIDGQVIAAVAVNTDVTDRRRTQEALRELNETLEQRVIEQTAERNRVWEMSRDLFAIMGFDGRLKAINPAWATTFGMDTETLLALSFREQVHPDDHAAVEAMIERLVQGETVDRFEDRIRHADGSWRWISWTLVPEGDVFYAVGRDVTGEKQASAELEHAQEALRQSQKMEAMGQLTGGVAHDFNNLLTPIIGSLDMLQRRASATEREGRLIDGALQSAEKAKTLVQRLLAFARRQPLQPQAVNLRQLVGGMAELITSTSGPQVKMVADMGEDLPFAHADPNQLEMAILNLAVNARDAMPDGGTLRISAKPDEVGEEHRSKLPPGRYIRLSVADTGVGMDEATLARAVEPFFSTKGIGRGTGLGLSMVHGLAAQLGGALAIDSKSGLGTCIELWLPVTDAAAARPEEAVTVGRATSAGTALLVDDEELVRASTADMLSALGYAVVEASSGEEALRLVDGGLSYDLLVTDHLMPGMRGADLARELQARVPGAPSLLVSGYADVDGIASDLPRLNKPFREADLAAALEKMMKTTP